MRHSLTAIEQDGRTLRFCEADYLFHRHHRAQRIGDMRYRHHPCPRREQFFVFVHQEFAGIVDRNDLDDCTGLLRNHLPGDNVRMMLQHGQDYLVPRLQVCPAPARRDKIDPLGRPAHEDDFLLVRGIEKRLRLDPGGLHRVGGHLAHIMHAAVHIRVFRLVGP